MESPHSKPIDPVLTPEEIKHNKGVKEIDDFFKQRDADARNFLQSQCPDIMDTVQRGDFRSAEIKFGDLDLKTNDANTRILRARIFREIKQEQVDKFILSGDVEMMKKLVKDNEIRDGLGGIGLRNIAKMPEQVTQDLDLRRRLTGIILSKFSPGHLFDAFQTADTIKEMVDLNLMTKEYAKEIINSKEVQEFLQDAIESVPFYSEGKARDFVRVGLIDKERADRIISHLKTKEV